MARRKIREFNSKKLLAKYLEKVSNGKVKYSGKCAQVSPTSDMDALLKENSWLAETQLVVKPDMLFGKRGANNLVLLDGSWEDAKAFIKEKMGKEVEIGKANGAITHFIIEPFVKHSEEHYLSITPGREEDTINFSTAGGVEIEENWDKVVTFKVRTEEELSAKDIEEKLPGDLPTEQKTKTAEFIEAVYNVFRELDFTLLEFNPFTYDSDGNPLPLDARGELDDTAAYKSEKKW